MEHGGNASEVALLYGIAPADMLDLSAAISPISYPLPPLVQSEWQTLPNRLSEQAVLEAARQAYQLPSGVNICLAAGSQSLLQAAPYLLSPTKVWHDKRVTYNEHLPAWAHAGHDCLISVDMPPAISAAIIVRPNNPDGFIMPIDRVLDCAHHCQRQGGFVLVDEAFSDVIPEQSLIPYSQDLPLVITRSFGKFFGLAGLRLGFAIGQEKYITALRARIGPWPVAMPALQAALCALADRNWHSAHRQFLSNHATQMKEALSMSGLDFTGGCALFLTFSHDKAHDLHQYLARKGIWTRIYSSYPHLIRFGLPPRLEQVSEIADIVKK